MAGGEDGFKRRAISGDDLEPTPGAGLCLEEISYLGLDPYEVEELWLHLSRREYNVIDVLILEKSGLSIYVRTLIEPDCMRPLELYAELCNEHSRKGLSLAEEPEVVKVVLKKEAGRECVELVTDFDPIVKPRNLIEKLGITERFNIMAYRPVK